MPSTSLIAKHVVGSIIVSSGIARRRKPSTLLFVAPRELPLAAVVLAARAVGAVAPTPHGTTTDGAVVEDILAFLRH